MPLTSSYCFCFFFFFFNDTATTEIYTLSLHDALPICDEFLGNFVLTNLWNSALHRWIEPRRVDHSSGGGNLCQAAACQQKVGLPAAKAVPGLAYPPVRVARAFRPAYKAGRKNRSSR